MKAMVIQSDFTGGELDPKLYGRVGIPRYQSGLKTAKNVDIMVTGGATVRAGKKFVYNAGASITTRTIPFVIFRTDTTPASLKGYVVEFRSDNKIRFYLDGALIVTGGSTPYELTSPFTSANLSLIKYEQFNNQLYLVHPDFPPCTLTRTTDTSWAITNVPFVFETVRNIAQSYWTERINNRNIALSSICWSGTMFVAVGAADGTDAYILTSTDGTTWTERAPSVAKNIALNSICWSGTMFVAVGAADGTDAYILTSTDGTTWTERANPKNITLTSICWASTQLVAVGYDDGVTDAYILTSTNGVTWTEQANPKRAFLYSVCWSGSLLVAMGVEVFGVPDTYIITSADGITWTEQANPRNAQINSICWTGTQFIGVGNNSLGSNKVIITSPNGISWTERSDPKNKGLNSICWSGSQLIAVGIHDGSDAYIITSDGNFGYEGLTRSGQVVTAGTIEYHGWKSGTIVTITGATQTDYNGTFVITVVDDRTFTYTVSGSPATPATGTITAGRVPWGSTGYPAALTFFEQRMLLARTSKHPQTVWGSETNNIYNFVLGALDSDPFEFVPAAAASSINQMITTSQVVLLTNDKEITMSGGANPLTPSNVQIKAVGRYGSRDGIRPLPIGGELVFSTRSGKRVRGMSYKLVSDAYEFPNVCIMSEHLLTSGIVEMYHAIEPNSTVYILTADGKIARVAYDREQEVVAFSWYETDGLYKGLCVVQEGLKDQIYATVERTIGGTAYTYMELFDPTLNTDSAVTGTDGTGKTTWTGLSHLEGKTVDVIADGVDLTPMTVTSGQIVLPTAAKAVEIGLHFEAEIHDLPVELPVGDGTTQGRTSVSVSEITVRMHESIGCTINGQAISTGASAFTGDKKVTAIGWGVSAGQVEIKRTQPMPFTVLAIIKRVTVND